MRWMEIEEGQFLFNKNLRKLSKSGRAVFLAVVFSSLLLSAAGLCSLFLPWSAPGHVWALSVFGGAVVLYLVLACCKVWINRLRRSHSVGWIPLFLFCVAFTCILPGWIAYPFLHWITVKYHPATWTLEVLLTYFVYGQYNFLNNSLPFFNGG